MKSFEEAKRIHFIGIGGAGMSAIASWLLARGTSVTGSDLYSSEVTDRLIGEGAEIGIGHKAEQVTDADWIIYSDAIPPENTEMVKAKELGLPIWRRSQLLGFIMKKSFGIAVTGTHGKTTTTAMLGTILIKAGIDPTILLGGDFTPWGGNTRVGEGKVLVAEACEAYNSFLDLSPQIGIITNVDADHLDFHGTEEVLRGNFGQFTQNLPKDGHLILWADDPYTETLAASAKCTVTTFGLNERADVWASDISLLADKTTFTLQTANQVIGTFNLCVPGLYNVLNAIAAVVCTMVLDVKIEDIQTAVRSFNGVHRRMELIGEANGITIIDDYAHHPTEINASIEGLRQKFEGRRLIVIFQPHLYSRTRDFLQAFISSLSKADLVVLTDIYPAREEQIPGVSSARIVEGVEKTTRCIYIPNRHKIVQAFLPKLQCGDVIVTMGAGNIVDTSHQMLTAIVNKHSKPLSVAVFMGGNSAEREISLSSGRMAAAALNPEKYEVKTFDPGLINTEGRLRGIHDLVHGPFPNFALNLLHGIHGEDGCIQGFLELLGIPYSGSSVAASVLSIDKEASKKRLEAVGIRVPKGITVSTLDEIQKYRNEFTFPLVIKPNSQGSTIGLSFASNWCELEKGILIALQHDELALVEEQIIGTEISVSILGNSVDSAIALPIVEIVPKNGKYDFESKYTIGATDEICPARLSNDLTQQAQETSIKAFFELGCRGFGRVDIIIRDEEMFVLEVNTVPGMTPTSLFPKSASTAGISFEELVEKIIQLGLEAK